MEIIFRTTKLAKLFNSFSALQAEFGTDQAKKIEFRLSVLKHAANLGEVPVSPPERRHELTGEYEGCFVIDVKHPYRLIFKPDYNEVPRKPDGGMDLQKINKIEILEITDYH